MHHKKKTHKMRGGFLNNLLSNAQTAISNFSSNLSNDTAKVWDNTKKATSSAYNSVVNPSPSATSVGGRRKHRRTHRGGFHGYSNKNGVDTNAATFSGNTAQPLNWVGGKKTKRRHRSRRR
jgi:hypothetical protein